MEPKKPVELAHLFNWWRKDHPFVSERKCRHYVKLLIREVEADAPGPSCRAAIDLIEPLAEGKAAKAEVQSVRQALAAILKSRSAGLKGSARRIARAAHEALAPDAFKAVRAVESAVAEVLANRGTTGPYRRPDEEAIAGAINPKFIAHLREVFYDPLRWVILEKRWRSAAVVGLARAIYADRAFERLPILADALEEAGCDNRAVLDHCRGPGPHARGCWVVDLILERKR
jgi:hypothetical protein